MTQEALMALIGLFCSAVSSVITFFLTRKKYNSEVEAQQIQNIKEAFTTYKEMMEDNIKTQNNKIAMLEKENENLRNIVSQLQLQISRFLIGQVEENN